AVALAGLHQLFEELLRRDVEAAFALDQLHDEAGVSVRITIDGLLELPERPVDELRLPAELLRAGVAPERDVIDRGVHRQSVARGGVVADGRHREAAPHEAVLEREHAVPRRAL